MSIVCLDTHIVIWGIKKQAAKGQENMIVKAESFLAWLDESKKKVIIPVPVISELLVPVPNDAHEKFLQTIHSKFRVVPFDEIAAVKMAQIFSAKADEPGIKAYRAEHQIPREKMKIDFQIASIAIVRQAECIYSHDPRLKKFVGDLIQIKEMPNIGIQTTLTL
jgi:predicted nucleic acid-binding protein